MLAEVSKSQHFYTCLISRHSINKEDYALEVFYLTNKTKEISMA